MPSSRTRIADRFAPVFPRPLMAVVMSLRTLQLGIGLIAALPLVGCSRSDSPSVSNDPAAQSVVVEIIDCEPVDLEELLFVECEEHEADTILEIRVTIPNVMDNYAFRIALCRRVIRDLDSRVCGRGFAADGVSPDGFGIGYGGGIRVDHATDNSVNVSLSLYWTATDRTRGSFKESLPVTIGEPSAKVLDGNIQIRWTFEDPVPMIDDGAEDAT